MSSITECGYPCITYITTEGEYDVAGYNPECPIHGWRWNYTGPALTLDQCKNIDENRLKAENE